jgi:hypothetical protein
MKSNVPKIKVTIAGDMLQAMRAVLGEFDQCGKVSKILMSTNSEKKNMKMTDEVFLCVYVGIINALNSHHYPNKSGNEYRCLVKLKEFLEDEHVKQRGCEID